MTPGAISGLRLRQEAAATAGHAPALPAKLRAIEVQARPTQAFSSPSFHRRALGFADSAAVTITLFAVLALLGKNGVLVGIAGTPLVLALFKLGGLYDRDELRLAPSTLNEVPRLLELTGLLILAFVILQPALLPSGISGAEIATLWLTAFLGVTTGRTLVRWLTRRTHAAERCLVLGDLEQARRIRERLAESRARAQVITCVPLSSDDVDAVEIPSFVTDLIREQHIERVIVAPAAGDKTGGAELIRMVKAAGVSVSVLPRILDAVGAHVEFDEVDGLTFLGVRRFGLCRSSRLVKRLFDIVVASAGLVAVGPIILAVAVAIRLDSKGPVFFRQLRVGRDGKYFSMIKFRSMVSDAEALKDELRALSQPGDGLFKIADDPRVTTVGRFLRRSSLDELPQVFNVLRGEMSLVGPRPLVLEEDELVVGFSRSRLHLTPGMTGPWQVMGLRLPLHEMVEVDYRYVANWSLWLDFKLLLRTVPHVLRRGNV
jgi:exopolysaccharide biosynthesis polyprenyl glycosylphosphotransferase